MSQALTNTDLLDVPIVLSLQKCHYMESYKELTGGPVGRPSRAFTALDPCLWELRSCKLHGTAKINGEYISRLILHVTFEVCLLSIGRMHLPLIRVVLLSFIAVHYFILCCSQLLLHSQLRNVWVVFHFW